MDPVYVVKHFLYTNAEQSRFVRCLTLGKKDAWRSWATQKRLALEKSLASHYLLPPVLNQTGKAIALWSMITLLAVAYPLFTKGGNTSEVYFDGARALSEGRSPYQLERPPDNTFKYSPAFAVVMIPFARLPHKLALFLWAILCTVVYWWGIYCWIPPDRSAFGWFWNIFLAMEVNGSLIHGQMNPLLAGGILLALDQFRRERWGVSSGLLVTLSNFKIIPGLALVPALWRSGPSFWGRVALVSLVLFLLPLPWLGLEGTFRLHQEWFHLLFQDGTGQRSFNCADVRSIFEKMGLAGIANLLYALVALATAAALVWPPRRRTDDWPWWAILILTALVLLNPKTETPSYVIAAPAVALIAYLFRGSSHPVELGVAFLCAVLITFLHNDIWPQFLFKADRYAPRVDYKMVGTLLTWGMALQAMVQRKRTTNNRIKRMSPPPLG